MGLETQSELESKPAEVNAPLTPSWSFLAWMSSATAFKVSKLSMSSTLLILAPSVAMYLASKSLL